MKRDPWTETAAPADGVLRFMTCGSVDDGKSTLIGRLLFDTRALLSDTLATMQRHAQRQGLSAPDLALLTDGLIAEREQGITIDVAYRYFATARRKFVIADSPGHEQYTRNMVTAASTADAAVLLVDARKGLLAQTRRHAALAALLGVRHLVLAVNKMDLVGHAQPVFEAIVAEFRAWLAGHGGLAGERELGRAHAGQSVMVWLADERDVSRGDLIVRADEPPVAVLESFNATVCWLSARPLQPGITWQLRHGTRELKGRVEAVEHLLDVQTLRWAGAPAAATLQLNDIGRLRLRTQPLPAQPYGELRAGGSFILVDPATRETVAAGWID